MTILNWASLLLIVAETARQHGVWLTFTECLRAGVHITLATLTQGVLWLSWVH